MIRKEKGELIAECDECGTEFPSGIEVDLRSFVGGLKDAGWSIEKDEGEWLHICPECR